MSHTNFWKPLASLTWADVESLKSGAVEEGTTLDYKAFGRNPTEKGGWPSRDRIAELLAAMSNTAEGRVVLGAESDDQDHLVREFRGVPPSFMKAALSRVHEAAACVQPPCSIDTKWVKIDGKEEWILIVEILPGRPGPRQAEGTYRMRVGASNRWMPHSLVETMIRVHLGSENGWKRSAFLNPLESSDMVGVQDSNLWQFGVWLHAHYEMPHLLDAGDEDGLASLKAAFAQAGLAGARYGLTTAGFEVQGKRRLRFEYTGSAWETISAAFLTPHEYVPMDELGNHLESSVRRLARIFKQVGYEQHVSVNVMLHKNTSNLVLRWQDGTEQLGVWRSTQELGQVLMDELISDESPVLSQLRRRFITYVRRQAEINGPMRLG